ncbi:hypothetical protein C5N14_21885 [Micromonospora sp. MW-13]|nr:hypothetical protein C5N14_21885 [Micromonospora sp. MW-13]
MSSCGQGCCGAAATERATSSRTPPIVVRCARTSFLRRTHPLRSGANRTGQPAQRSSDKVRPISTPPHARTAISHYPNQMALLAAGMVTEPCGGASNRAPRGGRVVSPTGPPTPLVMSGPRASSAGMPLSGRRRRRVSVLAAPVSAPAAKARMRACRTVEALLRVMTTPRIQRACIVLIVGLGRRGHAANRRTGIHVGHPIRVWAPEAHGAASTPHRPALVRDAGLLGQRPGRLGAGAGMCLWALIRCHHISRCSTAGSGPSSIPSSLGVAGRRRLGRLGPVL